MRIALAHAFCWPEVRRGAERLVGELGPALARHGHDVTLLSSAFAAGRALEDGVHVVRFRRWRQDVGGAQADFGLRVLPALVRANFDVVHSFGRREGVASLRAARLGRHRLTAHTDVGIPDRAWWATQGKEARYAERVIRDVDVYGCMSRHALGVLRADYGRDGVLLPGGVNLDTFRPGPPRTDVPTILFSAALDEPRKGLPALLGALPLIAREEPDVRLVLSGPGDPERFLAVASAAARERVDVVGPGRLEEQPIRYAQAWVCALPSLNDTFGLALLEALACGTPLVAADNAAPPELVDPGVTGALCTYEDIESTVQACLTAIHLAREPGTADACRESARPYDWFSGVAPRHIAAYEAARR